MEIKLLSKYRTMLMGFAMILVAIFHSSLKIDHIPILGFVKFIGDMGVDIFFFVSGLGMYYSFQKNNTTVEFYKKRILRIIPVWVVINLIVQIYGILMTNQTIEKSLLNLSGLSFWLTGSLFYWYVPAIIVLYLVTPIFMKMFKCNICKAYAYMFACLIVLIGICFVLHNSHLFIFLFRVPIYFVGIYIGKLSSQNEKISAKELKLVTVLLIVGLAIEAIIMLFNGKYSFVKYYFKYIFFFITAIALCLLLSFIFDRLNINESKVVGKILMYIGTCTLEIYLLHEFVLARCIYFSGLAGIDTDKIFYSTFMNIVVFVAVVFLAHFINSKKIITKHFK